MSSEKAETPRWWCSSAPDASRNGRRPVTSRASRLAAWASTQRTGLPAGAVGAVPAGGDVGADDPVAARDVGDPGADLLDDAGGLVTEHHRQRPGPVAVDDRQVGVAQPGGDDPHEHLARARGRRASRSSTVSGAESAKGCSSVDAAQHGRPRRDAHRCLPSGAGRAAHRPRRLVARSVHASSRGGWHSVRMADGGVAGLVLAAGAGRRMGGPKALLRLAPSGPSLVETAVARLHEAGVTEVHVVVGLGAERHRAGRAGRRPRRRGPRLGRGDGRLAAPRARGARPTPTPRPRSSCSSTCPTSAPRSTRGCWRRPRGEEGDLSSVTGAGGIRRHPRAPRPAGARPLGGGARERGRRPRRPRLLRRPSAPRLVECGDLATGRDIDRPPTSDLRSGRPGRRV